MFSKLSRYRKLPDEVTLDVKGRRLASKSLRLPPSVEERFVHTLSEGDRLDHLAFKYYRQPRDWWRICDANAQVLSPWELVGAEPRTTVRVEISRIGAEAPWSVLLTRLRRSPGVESALLGGADEPFPALETSPSGDTYSWSLTLVFNPLTTTLAQLSTTVQGAGFAMAGTAEIGRVGKPVAIPPRA